MKKALLVFLGVILTLGWGKGNASETTKVNLRGNHTIKYYKIDVNSDRTVVLKGVILADNVSLIKERIIEFKETDDEAPIFIIINSPGGNMQEGYELVTLIQSVPNPIYCIIETKANSMAAIISQYCTKTYIQKYAIMMFHEGSYQLGGSVSQIHSRVLFMDTYANALEEDLARQMGIPQKEYKKLIASEWWVTAKEAAKSGLVDGVIEDLYYTAQPPEIDATLNYIQNVVKELIEY